MRKQTKIVAVLSAAALLAIGASMNSFAATGWQAFDGTYVYYDANGDMVTDSWKKDGDQYFYLDGDGYMATNQMIDEYYVGANGARVKNTWVKLINEDEADDPEVEASWYYFGANAKAVESGWKTINGKSYFFDDSKMQSGWYTDNEKTYYLGGEDEGWRTTGWAWLEENNDDDENATGEEYWYYFKSNGQMIKSSDCDAKGYKISGKRYIFDNEGRMIIGWYTGSKEAGYEVVEIDDNEDGSLASISNAYYSMDNVDTGYVVNGWIKVPQLTASADTGWYYFKDGKPYFAGDKETTRLASVSDAKRATKTIKGKTYCFDEKGIMKSGIVDVEDSTIVPGEKVKRKFYFSDSADSDGSMKTGKIKVYDSDEDETFTYYFSDKADEAAGYFKGEARRGLYKDYFYNTETSRMVKADSTDRYVATEAVKDAPNGYLVNTSGKIMKAAKNKLKYLADKNDNFYVIDEKGAIVVPAFGSKEEANAYIDANPVVK